MTPILFWDIESTNLKADWGRALCIGFKYLDAPKTEVWSVADVSYREKRLIDDRRLVVAFWKVLCAAPVHVTYYGSRFDLPYLQAKALKYGLTDVPHGRHIDLYFVVRAHMALSRRRLDNVQKYLELPEKKSPLVGETWLLAAAGDARAMRYIVQHCRADVRVLEQAYQALLPVISRWGPCPSCSNPLRCSNGIRLFEGKPARRVWCQTCGAWEQQEVRVW